jgi:alkaline phosphatase
MNAVKHLLASAAFFGLTGLASAEGGSAIFLHPDGMGTNTWAAARLLTVGPDGRLAWDRLETAAAYAGPMLDSVTASSNGGGTSHAWGVRAKRDSFGLVDGQPLVAASGASVPLMVEAKRAGRAIGIVNTASVTDAGTGTQLAVVTARRDHQAIAAQMMDQEPDVILGGGEAYFLPIGIQGRHGEGQRRDGRNLIEEARAKGYTVVFTADELAALPAGTARVLGLFAEENTFNEGREEDLRAKGQPVFQPQAPRYDAMVAAALKVLRAKPGGFYLMAEEEATDNLGGDNNAEGVLEAASGADRAIGHALEAALEDKSITVLVASDSDCGGMQPGGDDAEAGKPLPARTENGAPMDGQGGTGGIPFLTAPNAQGERLPFAIFWAADGDVSGGGLVRATGPGAAALKGTADSTDVYRALYLGIFGKPAGG